MISADFLDRIEVGHAATHVNRHNTSCGGGKCFSYGYRIQGQGIIHIHDNRNGAHTQNRFKAGNKCE